MPINESVILRHKAKGNPTYIYMKKEYALITEKLRNIEKEYGIKILYAVESGSRAWGFASKDSDYDVRFIYIHDRNWYLSIDPKRDVVEIPLENNLDINGWDFIKALSLFRKSNPPLYEWLQSPIVYVRPHPSILKLRKFIPDFFSPKACLMHYLSMADNNYKDYVSKPEIKLKKYFYVLRPIFACTWIKKFESMPPTEFDRLMGAQKLTLEFKQTIKDLLENKKAGLEQDLKPRIKLIDDYVNEKILYFKLYAERMNKVRDLPYEPLNELFRKTLLGLRR